MSVLVAVHVVSAVALALAALALTARPRRDDVTRQLAIAAAAFALLVLATGVLAQPVFEAHERRAIYLVSQSAGHWIDHVTDLGIGACGFALAAALATRSSAAPAWLYRGLAALTLAFALAAFVADAYVHARAPNALVREVPRFS